MISKTTCPNATNDKGAGAGLAEELCGGVGSSAGWGLMNAPG